MWMDMEGISPSSSMQRVLILGRKTTELVEIAKYGKDSYKSQISSGENNMHSPIYTLAIQGRGENDPSAFDKEKAIEKVKKVKKTRPQTASTVSPINSARGSVRSVLHVRCRAEDIGVTIISP
jgi:hypothetical protein